MNMSRLIVYFMSKDYRIFIMNIIIIEMWCFPNVIIYQYLCFVKISQANSQPSQVFYLSIFLSDQIIDVAATFLPNPPWTIQLRIFHSII